MINDHHFSPQGHTPHKGLDWPEKLLSKKCTNFARNLGNGNVFRFSSFVFNYFYTLRERRARNSAKKRLFMFLFIWYKRNQSPMLKVISMRALKTLSIGQLCEIPAVPYVVLDMFDVLVVGEVFVHCHLHHEVANITGEDLNTAKQHPRTHDI